MVSVMLMSISMLTASLLVVKSSQNELDHASALIARERAADVHQGGERVRLGHHLLTQTRHRGQCVVRVARHGELPTKYSKSRPCLLNLHARVVIGPLQLE